MTVIVADIDAQLNGGSNSHLFDKARCFYAFTPCKRIIMQITGDFGHYEGVDIVLGRIGRDLIVLLYSSYLMPNNPQNTIDCDQKI